MISEESNDEEFLIIEISEKDHKRADFIINFLMFVFIGWTALFYYKLAKYNGHNEDTNILYFGAAAYCFFFIWPILEVIVRFCCKRACKNCYDRYYKAEDEEKLTELNDDGEKVEHADDSNFKGAMEMVEGGKKKLNSIEE